MLPTPFENALVLTGPTGSGKTRLGIELAHRLDAEIISMDSMALYRGMDIGTAKPTPEERAAIPHHLVDVREPWESGSVAWWLEQAKNCAREIESRGKRVLFVGGTPLYLKALIAGLFEGPPGDDALRQRLTAEAEAGGLAILHRRLAEVDPASALRIHPNDLRRTVRALEVYELTGTPMSAWQTQWTTAPPPSPDATPAVLWLDLPRAMLYDRINRRVVEMFAAGFVEEVRRLRSGERGLSLEASKALGYAEVGELLNGRITCEEAIDLIQTRSRNFAKRQLTWFRHIPECRRVTIDEIGTLWSAKMKR